MTFSSLPTTSIFTLNHNNHSKAFRLFSTPPPCSFTRREFVSLRTTSCCVSTIQVSSDQNHLRRSANYKPCIWNYDYVQSLSSIYTGETYRERVDILKEEVRKMLCKVENQLEQLEVVDALQRLGVFYHFKDEIRRILENIYINFKSDEDIWNEQDLYAVALRFRLLREHGFHVPQEVFNNFKDKMGNFKTCICKDVKGMLSLYEASYFSVEGERILDEARDFTIKHLKENLEHNTDPSVSHALELPLHRRMLRLETRWFIDIYERRKEFNPTLLELAKLDFNIVQATHQADIKYTFTWWKNTGLGENLSFARDRLMETFFWTVGLNFEPGFEYYRRILTKINALITTIDDVYDVYGTLDELRLFTDAVERWDIKSMDHLPRYMKLCYLSLYNSINEMAYDVLKQQDVHIIPYLRKMWAQQCKAYLVEAEWYYSGYTPTLREYLDNAWVSVGAPLIMVHTYFLIEKSITKEALECLQRCPPTIIHTSSIIIRLTDDLGTSSDELKRGDVPKSIQCYMHETGASEEEARDYIRYLVGETWKKMNEDRVTTIDSPFSESFISCVINFARMSECMYHYGDGHGIEDHETKDHVLSLFIDPIPSV